MTLSELNEKYYFHDSTLDKLEYSDGELKLYVRFCDFMQENYDDRDDSNSDIIVVFQNARYKTDGNWKICDSGFLHQKIENDSIVFFMESSPYECGELLIKTSSVEVYKVRTYNL